MKLIFSRESNCRIFGGYHKTQIYKLKKMLKNLAHPSIVVEGTVHMRSVNSVYVKWQQEYRGGEVSEK